MLRSCIILLLLFCSAIMSAQPDSGTRAIAIPPASGGSPTQAQLPEIKPSRGMFDFPEPTPGKIEETELNSNFGKSTQWANPNEQYLAKLNKKQGNGENQEAIRKNQHMGDVRTGTSSVRIVYRDHEYPDGDMIRVLVNNQVVVQRIYLESDFSGFDLQLSPGFNKIDFEALNQGESGPNTAEFQVYDDKGNMISSNRWNLATGFKATVILIKE
jgi:hypothetical protein